MLMMMIFGLRNAMRPVAGIRGVREKKNYLLLVRQIIKNKSAAFAINR